MRRAAVAALRYRKVLRFISRSPACQRRQALIITLRPAVFNRNAPPLNESRAVQALEESGNDETQVILRQAPQKSDHRTTACCARRERPRGRPLALHP